MPKIVQIATNERVARSFASVSILPPAIESEPDFLDLVIDHFTPPIESGILQHTHLDQQYLSLS